MFVSVGLLSYVLLLFMLCVVSVVWFSLLNCVLLCLCSFVFVLFVSLLCFCCVLLCVLFHDVSLHVLLVLYIVACFCCV